MGSGSETGFSVRFQSLDPGKMTRVNRYLRRVGTRYGIGTVPMATSVGHMLSVARGYLVQWRHRTQFVVGRFVVRLLGDHHRSLLANAFLDLRHADGVNVALHGGVVTAQWQSPHTPIEIVRAFTLRNVMNTLIMIVKVNAFFFFT